MDGWRAEVKPGVYLQSAQGGGVVGWQSAVQLVEANAKSGEVGWQGGGQGACQLVAKGRKAEERRKGAGVEAGRNWAAEAGV